MPKSNSVENAIKALGRGEMVIVTDSESRENEGDLIQAACFADQESIAFMVRYSSGVLCVPLPGKRLDELDIPLMVARNEDSMSTAFTVTVDLKQGTSTGISAMDRAATIRALVAPDAMPQHFSRPGHIFPLRSSDGGVLQRPGHTEAATDLTRLAGLPVGGVIGELVNDDGTMMRGAKLKMFANHHRLCVITINDLIAYRLHIGDTELGGQVALEPAQHLSKTISAR